MLTLSLSDGYFVFYVLQYTKLWLSMNKAIFCSDRLLLIHEKAFEVIGLLSRDILCLRLPGGERSLAIVNCCIRYLGILEACEDPLTAFISPFHYA